MARELVARASAAGFPIAVTQTLRTYEEQARLYAQGRTLPGPIVTHAPAGYSYHNFGRAFDVAFVRGPGLSWSGPWEPLGDLAENLGLEWGGRWKHPDTDHFQHTGGLTLRALRAASATAI